MEKAYSKECFDIESSLTCGQVFRYKKLIDGSYEVISLAKKCKLFERDGKVILESDDIDYFENYFDLRTDYNVIIDKLKEFDELALPIIRGRGIRILRQDLLEMIISFIISANNNIPRIKGIIERLCVKAGENMGDYYAFPTLNQLLQLTESDFVALGAGFRANYLYVSIRMIAKSDILSSLSLEPTEIARKKLLSLKGVGDKVANCILFFGLHRTDSFPVDTWIFKALGSSELDTVQKVEQFYRARYGDYAGYAQQYIFYNAREIS